MTPRPAAASDWAALTAWALAAAGAAGALVGLSRHAMLVAIAFRALTAWRLTVAGGVLWRRDATRASTVRLAALGSGAAHTVLALSALGATSLGLAVPWIHTMCLAAARCSPVPWAMLPLAMLGGMHAAWLYRQPGSLTLGVCSPRRSSKPPRRCSLALAERGCESPRSSRAPGAWSPDA